MTADRPNLRELDETVTRHTWRGGEVHGVDVRFPLPSHRHHHRVPGVWDDDNGWAGGLLCHRCWTDGRPCSIAAVEAAEVAR
jgi:hypothetical protein